MNIELNIKPEDINQMVVNAIVNSALGEKLKESIDESIRNILTTSYYEKGVVYQVCEQEIRNIIRGILRTEPVQQQVKGIVERHFAEKLTDELLGRAINRLWDELLD